MCWVQHNHATQSCTLLWKFQILQWFVWRNMGTTLDLNKLWGQIECVLKINFATLFKVSSCLKFIIGLTNINFYILDCITHIKKLLLFLLVFYFILFLAVVLLDLFDIGKQNYERVPPNHLLIFQIVCKTMAFFCHVIFYFKNLFFVQIILMNWPQYINIVSDQQ